MAKRNIVVIGGALSGPTAAARARETDESAQITLLERARDVSYAVGGLGHHLSGEVASIDALNRERVDFFRDVYRIEVRTQVAVTAIDPVGHTVKLAKGALPYDALVFAAGVESIVPDLPGLAGASNVVRFRTLADLESIDATLTAGARRVTVLGGGYFGVEAADGLARRGCDVTLIEAGPRVLPQLGALASHLAAEGLRDVGVRIRSGTRVLSARRAKARVTGLRLSKGGTLEADLVVVATGVRPRTDMLRVAGAVLHADGSVAVDEHCKTSLPGVFACGVCIAVPHAVTGLPTWMPQAAVADKSAQVAGACAAGADVAMEPVVGSAIVRAGSVTVARSGLTREEAVAFVGADVDTVQVHVPSHDTFLPGAELVSIELAYRRSSGEILGAQVAGRDGADKRADVLATAVHAGMSVEQIAMLDLSYAASYSSARDPVNVAGAVAASARAGKAEAWSAERVWAHRGAITLVDVRGTEAAVAGTIEGAKKVALVALRGGLAALPAGRPVVFVCDTGRHGYLAARIAKAHGRDAGYLSGGLRSWVGAGRRLATGGR